MIDMKEMTVKDAEYILEHIRQDTISCSDKLRIEEIIKAELKYLRWLENFKPKCP